VTTRFRAAGWMICVLNLVVAPLYIATLDPSTMTIGLCDALAFAVLAYILAGGKAT
jgi:hypothetical protein